MANTKFKHKIDSITVYTSPKCSCRSVNDFCNEIKNKKNINTEQSLNILIFRNPYKRLISGYLNKYVEHEKYHQKAKDKNKEIRIETFYNFVNELTINSFENIDMHHFSKQVDRSWLNQKNLFHINFDFIYDSENLQNFSNKINEIFLTSEMIPFRVNQYGPKHYKQTSNENCFEIWNTNRIVLLDMITKNQIPNYKFFYNEEIKNKVYNFYKDDFDLINRYFKKGIIDVNLYKKLTFL